MKIQIEDKALIEEQKKRISELELLEFTLKKTEEDLRLHQIELEMQNQELRLVQSNLDNALNMYSDLFDNAPIPYFKFNETGTINEINRSGELLLNVQRNYLIGRSFTTFLNTTSATTFYKHLRFLFTTQTNQSVELELINLNKEKSNIVLHSNLFQDPTLKKTFCRSIAIDITEKKKIENKLILKEEKYRNFIRQSNDGFVLTNEEGDIIEWNQSQEIITGIEKELAIGKKIWDIQEQMTVSRMKDDQKIEAIVNSFKQYYETGKANFINKQYEVPIINKENIEKIIMQVVFGYTTSAGYCLGSVARDITKIKEYETDLIKSKEKAEESDRLKTAFLQNVSHEIRTPLNAILGFTEILVKDELEASKKENFRVIIKQAAVKLLNIIENIIEISKVQANDIVIKNEEFVLADVVWFIFNKFKPIAEAKGLELICDLQNSSYKSIIRSDSDKIGKILSHLIDNAIKFTKQGYVKLYCPAFDYKNGFIEFAIEDTGMGIPANRQQTILLPFGQAETKLSKNIGGNGIGLTIAKAYIEKMGGQLWLESAIEAGTTFHFTLTFKPVQIQMKDFTTNDSTQLNLAGKTILIAEDEIDNFVYLAEVLSITNAHIIHAKNGKEAIDIFNKNQNICIILMDIKMPEIDGYEATQYIKAQNPKIPILAQTAFVNISDTVKMQTCGFDGYVAKPINMNDILTKIQKLLNL